MFWLLNRVSTSFWRGVGSPILRRKVARGLSGYEKLRGGDVCSIREVKLDCDSFTQDSAAVIEICSRLD